MTLPTKPSGTEDQEDYRIQMQHIADHLNKQTEILNHELSRIKILRATLNLGRLDPLIEAARGLVRPLYTLSASLQD
jgi:phosphoenolpyruvate carboxylase